MRTCISTLGIIGVISLLSGCYSSSPGVVRTSADNPIVVIGAGEIEVGSGTHYYARYIIDTRARLCWFFAGDSVSPMDCCSLLHVTEAQSYITWASPQSCAAASERPATAPRAEPPSSSS